MKKLNILYRELESRTDFKLCSKGFDGGMGFFTRGSLKGASIIWSFAGGWEHVSICPEHRTPDWNEMCMLKDMFWGPEEAVMQLHPPKSKHINNMKNCLHLWKPIKQYSGEIPLPPELFVGIKEAGELG